MNIEIVASAGMLIYAGYAAGAAMLPESVGGKGFDEGQTHEILAPFIEPIAAAVLVQLCLTFGNVINLRENTMVSIEIAIRAIPSIATSCNNVHSHSNTGGYSIRER